MVPFTNVADVITGILTIIDTNSRQTGIIIECPTIGTTKMRTVLLLRREKTEVQAHHQSRIILQVKPVTKFLDVLSRLEDQFHLATCQDINQGLSVNQEAQTEEAVLGHDLDLDLAPVFPRVPVPRIQDLLLDVVQWDTFQEVVQSLVTAVVDSIEIRTHAIGTHARNW